MTDRKLNDIEKQHFRRDSKLAKQFSLKMAFSDTRRQIETLKDCYMALYETEGEIFDKMIHTINVLDEQQA